MQNLYEVKYFIQQRSEVFSFEIFSKPFLQRRVKDKVTLIAVAAAKLSPA